MAFCVQCGYKLREGVRFCESCGVQVAFDDDGIEDGEEPEEDVDEGDGVEEIEDGDDEVMSKGLDPSHGYYMSFAGRNATLYRDDGAMVRRFRMSSDVVQATISGETVAIVTDDGYLTLFSWTGAMIRRTRQRH